jgi:hypothetical protein
MSAKVVAIATAVTGIYGANKASSAASAAAAAQERSAAALAGQADRAAQLSYDLGQDQLAFSRQQYEEMSPLARQVAESQLAAQDEQMRQGRDYYDYMTSTFRPIEQGLARDAEAFNTEAYRNQLAEQAAADAATAFRNVQGQTSRGFSRMGVGPGSGAAMAQMNQNALGLASMRAGAMTGARQQAEQMGFARRLDVTGLGRNLPGASTAAYGAATQAGTAGLQSAATPGQTFVGNMGSAANTMLAGSGQALNAYSALYGGANRMAMGAQDNYFGTLGGLVGMGGTIAASQFGRP